MKVGENDIFKATAENQAAGGDMFKGFNDLLSNINQTLKMLTDLSTKTGIPLIGNDAAIKRLNPSPATPHPTEANSLATAPKAPSLPPQAAILGLVPMVLDRLQGTLDKTGIGDITVGQALKLLDKKTFNDLLGEIKKGVQDGQRDKS
ncbi:hypothetical protein [Dehalococcoides mccartyi]|uniref:Uncharacterized protein n=1 Tax=Dehalococcoides mccartyi (strain CBDB1) TaxID=255470 RepID=A0A916KM96_DEHMC|nr:hypothetical protein [Dehalococcoides mccartyi]CAI82867.1 hypothetical protein cbdbA705 [Dehalococcoides mccartyi CBDB1]